MKTLVTAVLALVLAPGAALPSQKLPVRDPDGRVVQIIDLAPLLRGGDDGDDGATRPAPPAGAAAPAPGRDLALPAGTGAAIASFVRSFVQPPLGAGDDVQALGGHWLAVLGSPQQATSAEQLIATAVRSREDHVLTVIRIADLTQEVFGRHVLPLLPVVAADAPPGARQAILDGKAAGDLLVALKAADVITSAPRLVAAPLQRAHISIAEEIAYIKDFELVVAGKESIADPVVGTIWDGVRVDLIASYTGKDRIGLHCTLEKQDVVRPIPEFQTTPPGYTVPLTIQLPQVTGVRLQQTAEVPVGSTVLIAARKTHGGWLAALVEVRRARE